MLPIISDILFQEILKILIPIPIQTLIVKKLYAIFSIDDLSFSYNPIYFGGPKQIVTNKTKRRRIERSHHHSFVSIEKIKL